MKPLVPIVLPWWVRVLKRVPWKFCRLFCAWYYIREVAKQDPEFVEIMHKALDKREAAFPNGSAKL